MTQKEIIDIGLNLMVLTDYTLDKGSSVEDVANCAIKLLSEMLKKYPKLREFIDDAINDFDENDDDFDQLWDRQIAWIKFEKDNL